MKPVIAPPLLPYPSGNDIMSLRAFDADLRRALVEILTQYALRINGSLPKDGSEPMTGPLNIDGFYIDIFRAGAPAQHFQVGITGSAGHLITGYSDAGNGKGFIFNARTDNVDTAPSAGENSYSFQVRSVEKLRIDDSTNSVDVKAGVLLDVQSGQVKFPATQAASSNANTLDDYEEGTWTPVLSASTPGDLAVTYSNQQGRYQKVGNRVTVQFVITTSAFTYTTATGEIRITGLPFTTANIANFQWIGAVEWGNNITLPGGRNDMTLNAINNVTYMRLVASGNAVARTAVNIATDTTSGSTIVLQGTLTYEAAN